MRYLVIPLIMIVSLFYSCQNGKKEEQTEKKVSFVSEPYGTMPDGTQINQYTLTNANGVEMKVINYGGIITSLKVPDKEGNLEDIVLGFDNLESYVKSNPYFGAIIGRYGNRIDEGKFTLDSVEYELATNNAPNHLHGGVKGFDKVVWEAKEVKNDSAAIIQLSYTSQDMEEGYPGKLDVVVTYTLGNDNSLEFNYKAETDKKTIVNLTQHSYFNLTAMKDDILNHELMINASKYLPVDSTLIPTGELRPVEGTPFDFTTAKPIGKDIQMDNQQLEYGLGYDHCWILDGTGEMPLAARLYEPKSGRVMEIYTTEPGIQFYSGNFLTEEVIGKNGVVNDYRTGLCLETQHYPDSPNQPDFPSVVLNPGETYNTTTVYKFSTK